MIELLLAALVGGLHSLPFAYPALWCLQPLGVAWLLWRIDRASPRRAALLGGVFGFSWLICAVWWLFNSMFFYGGLPAWIAVLAVASLCGALALYLGVAMGLFARWRRRRLWADSVLVASLWLAAELARGMILTGFPWAASGYAHVDSPLAFLAPWLGVYGVGAVSTFLVALLVFQRTLPVSMRARWGSMGVSVAWVGLLPLVLPDDFTTSAGELSVALLQNNVPQQEKFVAPHLADNMVWTRDKLMSLPVDLVVAPETVFPVLPGDVPPHFWEPLLEHFSQAGRHALVGMPLGDFSTGLTNSALGLAASAGQGLEGAYRYDKHHLVPFGEFVPPAFRWFTALMHIPLGDFDRGPLRAPSFRVAASSSVQWVAPNICYEDLFGEELAARFVEARPPTVLANLSNIAWFGNTIAVKQHLQISRMRSLELQRPMLRSTNTGATAIIDHQGRVVNQLPPYTQAVLGGLAQGREGLTPFARWAGRWGLWPLIGLSLSLILLCRLRGP